MKLAITTAALAAAFACLATPSNALATDIGGDKNQYHGSDCKVFGATAWTDLHFSGYGVKNLATAARNVICPLVKGTEAPWDGESGLLANYARVHMHVEAGGVNGSVSCTVYVTDNFGSVDVKTYSKAFGILPAGTNGEADVGPFQSTDTTGDHDKAYMLCTLAPQTRLLGYYLYEGLGTD